MAVDAIRQHAWGYTAGRMRFLLEELNVFVNFVFAVKVESERANSYSNGVSRNQISTLPCPRSGVSITAASLTFFSPIARHGTNDRASQEKTPDGWRNISISLIGRGRLTFTPASHPGA